MAPSRPQGYSGAERSQARHRPSPFSPGGNAYRASRDLFLAQRFARHVSPLTTTVYTHPSDQELWQGVRGLNC